MKKQHILDEIRRTAKKNNDAPLGRLRFATETGIRESAWRGVYWARWNEAIREAGLEPNQKTIAYPTDVMMDRLVRLAREMQKFPTYSEIRLKARKDPSFPTDKTYARLGSKQALAAILLEYCQRQMGLDDITAFCAPIAHSSVSKPDATKLSSDENGFVYLMKSGRHYKIGHTNSTGRREYELAIQLPEKLETVHIIRTDDPVGIEAYWHKRFSSKRKNGEWFDLASSDVSCFKRRKFM